MPYIKKHESAAAQKALFPLFALLVMFAFTAFGYSTFQSHQENPIPKLDLLTPYYHLYSNGSATCQTSQYLYESVAMTKLCTDTFANIGANTLPYSIALFYYSFKTQYNATSYINSVISFHNTTPWPDNIAAFGQIGKYGNIKIYETTTVIIDPTNYTHVNTIYAQMGSEIIGVSSLSSSSSNFTSSESFDEQLLYNWYLLLNNSSR